MFQDQGGGLVQVGAVGGVADGRDVAEAGTRRRAVEVGAQRRAQAGHRQQPADAADAADAAGADAPGSVHRNGAAAAEAVVVVDVGTATAAAAAGDDVPGAGRIDGARALLGTRHALLDGAEEGALGAAAAGTRRTFHGGRAQRRS